MESNVEIKINKDEVKTVRPALVVWRRLKRNKLAIAGLVILICMILISIFGPFLSPYNLESMDTANLYSPPSFAHLLGTDQLGRDILYRVMYAGRISIAVGFVAIILEVILGSILGSIAGYYGGIVDTIIMRFVDIMLCVPMLPILIVLATVMSDLKVPTQYRIIVVMFIIGMLSWPSLCRIIRGQILTLREQEFMQAAEALGLSDRRKMFKHLLPNTVPTIIVTATLDIGGAILYESILSFLGLGVIPPTPSWGNMVQVVSDLYSMQNYPWLWIPPGICIFVTVMSINLFGDGLRDALDPKLKR